LQGHAGAFLDRATTNKALYSIASSVDIFSFGLLFLMALGLSKVSKRLSIAQSAATVGALWFVYVAAKAGLSLFF
jgi:hypothetical protein